MGKFLDRLMGRSDEEEYLEVDLSQFEDSSESSQEMMVLIAELNSLEVLAEIKKEIYQGNIVLVDIAPMKKDKASLDRAIGELRKWVEDVFGDIAGIGDDLVIAVPRGVRINRDKIIGGRD